MINPWILGICLCGVELLWVCLQFSHTRNKWMVRERNIEKRRLKHLHLLRRFVWSSCQPPCLIFPLIKKGHKRLDWSDKAGPEKRARHEETKAGQCSPRDHTANCSSLGFCFFVSVLLLSPAGGTKLYRHGWEELL